jgi:aminoglycoside phosphotransferase (APT) family kinase protein
MRLDVAAMMEALRGVLPGGEAITAVIPLTTGFSNDTYLIEGADLILRLPPQAGAMLDGHDVIAQARIYEELGQVAGGPKVPGIAYISENPALLGAPFFAMERLPGEAIHDTNLQDWFTGASDADRTRICRAWVSAFAVLAKLAPLPFLGEPVSPEDDARMWQAFGKAADCPELVELYDRLLRKPAPRSGPPAIVHGDTKLSNLMWHNGEISAVLDWEMALNGEPLADLGYILYTFESQFHGATTPARQPGMLKRDQVIALWSQISGRSAEGVEWHEIAQIGKISAIIAEGTNMYVTGRSQDPKLAYFLKNREYYLGVMRAMLDGGGF